MPTDRTLSKAEQEWIAKYRAALNQIPVQRPRFESFLIFLHNAKEAVVSKVGKMLLRSSSAARQTAVLATAQTVPVMGQSVAPSSTRLRKRPAGVGSGGKRTRKRTSAAN